MSGRNGAVLIALYAAGERGIIRVATVRRAPAAKGGGSTTAASAPSPLEAAWREN